MGVISSWIYFIEIVEGGISGWMDWMFFILLMWVLNGVICVGVLLRLLVFGELVVKKNIEVVVFFYRYKI